MGSGGHELGGVWVEKGEGTGRYKVLKPNRYFVAGPF